MPHVKPGTVRKTAISISLSAVLGAAVSLPLASDERGFVHLTPDQVPFKRPAAGLDEAVLFGDPAKQGIYVVRYRFPPGVHSNPHYHSRDRQITVIKGTWCMGTGDTVDIRKAVPLGPGSYAFHPARGVHWDGACTGEEAIVQVIGMGPVSTVPTDPKAPELGEFSESLPDKAEH